MNRSRVIIALVGVLLILLILGFVLLEDVLDEGTGGNRKALWPNKDFQGQAKVDFPWLFEEGEQFRFLFKGRENPPGTPKSIYDPESWSLRVFGESPERAVVQFFDGKIQILHGEMRPDGVIRVRSYTDYAEDPAEYWQTLLNLILVMPGLKLDKGESREEEIKLPTREKHKGTGKVRFGGEGEVVLTEGGARRIKIGVEGELDLSLREKGDLLTEYLVQG
ncbi:MAG: hypothetical protein ACYTHN_06440, partial [Planctomycetota bacterium]